jgi:hypothetical protein
VLGPTLGLDIRSRRQDAALTQLGRMLEGFHRVHEQAAGLGVVMRL